jgi:hypothetical protein
MYGHVDGSDDQMILSYGDCQRAFRKAPRHEAAKTPGRAPAIPVAKNASGRLERDAGLSERAGGATALLAWIAAWVEPAQPLPGLGRARIADALGNRADMNVAIVDKPAIGAVRIGAAGEIGHRRI